MVHLSIINSVCFCQRASPLFKYISLAQLVLVLALDQAVNSRDQTDSTETMTDELATSGSADEWTRFFSLLLQQCICLPCSEEAGEAQVLI